LNGQGVSLNGDNHLNRVAYFEIQVDDPERAIQFYQSVFGWQFLKVAGLPIDYWRITEAGPNGGLFKRPASTPPLECGTNAYVCSVEVEDIVSITVKITELGGQIALAKFAVPGVCWQAYFVDPEANTFGVFQPDDKARS
jgi:predicted enzyme related to lactoylglutathione lyase